MLKNQFYICLFLLFYNKAEAQNLSSIIDSCHYYLDKQDIMSFNNTYIRILDAYKKEYDAELYSIKEELKEMRIEDQSIRLLLLDASKKKQNIDKIRKIMDDIDRRNAVRVAELKEAVQKGVAKGWHYAFLTDRCLMNQGEKTNLWDADNNRE